MRSPADAEPELDNIGENIAPTRSMRMRTIAARISRLRDPVSLISIRGVVSSTKSTTISAQGLTAFVRLGDLVTIKTRRGDAIAQVAGVSEAGADLVPFATSMVPNIGDPVELRGPLQVRPHPSWKGRSLNALALPIDGQGPARLGPVAVDLVGKAPPALHRRKISEPWPTGVAVIDLFTPLCAGQRIGIFAGSGVGKSTLLAMMARAPKAKTIVVCLVGERGREVREFLEDTLGEVRREAVCVVATSDESPMMRRLAPRTAMSIAEYFRAAGEDVLLIVDSLTRFAHAEREFGLAAGELPVARGYPPSAFHEMAHLVERAGPGIEGQGSITLVAAVLVDADDHNDPVADSVRGLLDGHVVLDRDVAAAGRMPAVEIGLSISRLADRAVSPELYQSASALRKMVARFEQTKDLRMLGGHRPGTDPLLDQALTIVPKIYDLMQQSPGDRDSRSKIHQALALLRQPGTIPPSTL